jgi:HlyD family secretion protein
MYTIFDAYKKYLNYLFFAIVIIFVLFFIILQTIKIENTIAVPGTIISESHYTIKSQIDGDIENIFFKNGDRVYKDAILFSYSRQSIRQNIIELENVINEKINFKDDILKKAYEIIYYYKLNIDSINNKLAYLNSQLEYNNNMYTMKERLYEAGSISLDELNKQKLELDRLHYEHALLLIERENYDKNYNLNIEILNSHGINVMSIENVTEFIKGIDEEIAILREQEKIYKILLDNPYITAPVDGIVNFYDGYYYNDAIKNRLQINDLICDIYLDGNFIAKGLVQDIYLPFIKTNDEVYIQVNAYDYNRYGFISGNISKIYPSPVTNDGQKQYYIDASFKPLQVELYNGLEASIKVKLNEDENVFTYIIENILFNEKDAKQGSLLFLDRKIMK